MSDRSATHLPPPWLMAVSFATAAAILGDSMLYAVLPVVGPQLGLELWMVGLLLSANRFVRLLTNPFAGWVVDRVGIQKPFFAAVFVSVLTTAAYGLAGGFVIFLLARVLWGMCWSFLRLGGFLAALDSSDRKRHGYYIGFFGGVARGGTMVAALTGGLLTDTIGFRYACFTFAAVNAIVGLGILQNRRRAIYPQPDRSAGVSHGTATSDDAVRRRWIVYGGILIFSLAGTPLAVATLGRVLFERYGDTVAFGTLLIGVASFNGLLLATRWVIDSIGSPLAGHIFDQSARRRFFCLSASLVVIAMTGLSFDLGLTWMVVMGVALFGAGTVLRVGLESAAGALALPSQRARVMSWFATWSDFGSAAGAALAYPLAAVFGFDRIYQSSAGLIVAFGILAWLLWMLKSENANTGTD